MVIESYPSAQVLRLEDRPHDEDWSVALDGLLLGNAAAAGVGAVLYGSRGSFLGRYHGELETVRVPGLEGPSGSEVRHRAERLAHLGREFRAGIVYASRHRFPTSFQAVDIAVLREDRGVEVLLGSRSNEAGLRFPGGFVDPRDESLAAAAARELAEETGGSMMTTKPSYIGSLRVDDWRYRGESDQVMTALFCCKFLRGSVRADDDLESVRWFPVAQLSERIGAAHRPLAERLLHKINDVLRRL
jgi:bifunctional NMN adenylyltransferase/nudix hydrolase